MSGSERPNFGSGGVARIERELPRSGIDSEQSRPTRFAPGDFYINPDTGKFWPEILEKAAQISQGRY